MPGTKAQNGSDQQLKDIAQELQSLMTTVHSIQKNAAEIQHLCSKKTDKIEHINRGNNV